ncbi:MAG: zinc ribbon domain-containing protein [Candidatus Cloacimonetes bacterium]|nr:zinc ribbon domain-containing protein [Candidatus Cloacimonadota bacterium]
MTSSWNGFSHLPIQGKVKLKDDVVDFYSDRYSDKLFFIKSNGILYSSKFKNKVGLVDVKAIDLNQKFTKIVLYVSSKNTLILRDHSNQIYQYNLRLRQLKHLREKNIWKYFFDELIISNSPKQLLSFRNLSKSLSDQLKLYIGFNKQQTLLLSKVNRKTMQSCLINHLVYTPHKKQFSFEGTTIENKAVYFSYFSSYAYTRPLVLPKNSSLIMDYIIEKGESDSIKYFFGSSKKVYISKKKDVRGEDYALTNKHFVSIYDFNNSLQVGDATDKLYFSILYDSKLYWIAMADHFNIKIFNEMRFLDTKKQAKRYENQDVYALWDILNSSAKSPELTDFSGLDKLIYNNYYNYAISGERLFSVLLKRYQFDKLVEYSTKLNKKFKYLRPKPPFQALKAFNDKNYTKTVRILEKGVKEHYKKNKKRTSVALIEWIQVAVFDALGEYDRVTQFAIHMQKRLKKDWERDIHLVDTVRYLLKKDQLKFAKLFMSKFFQKNSYRAMAYNCMGLIASKEEKWSDAKGYFNKAKKLNPSIDLLFDINQVEKNAKISPKVLITPSSKSDKKACHSCQAELQKDTKFCSQCGTKVRPSNCVKCDHKLDRKSKFCSNCGNKI